MIRRGLRDLTRLYGRSWWRLGLVVVVTGLLLGLVMWLASWILRQLPKAVPSLVTHGHLTTTGLWELTAIAAVVLAVVCAPVAFAGMAATARVTDDSLAGRKPRIFRSLAKGLRHVPSLVLSGVLAAAGILALVILSPVISAVGILGLLATPLVRLAGRRWPQAAARWPSVRTLVIAAVPLAAAALWGARWVMVVPANVLGLAPGERRRSVAALRRSADAARGRWGTVVGSMLGSVVLALALLTGITWIGYQIDHDKGAVVAQLIGQLIFLGLPLAVATILFRLGEAATGGGSGGAVPVPAPSGGWSGRYESSPYAVGADPEPPPFLASDDPALMTPWRLRHRRTAFFMSFVLACTTAISVISVTEAGAGDGPPSKPTPAGSITLTVNSSADTTPATLLATEETACFSGTGTCTFRAAVDLAETLATGGTYGAVTIAFSTTVSVLVTAGDPIGFRSGYSVGTHYSGTLTIDGLGHEVVVDGQGAVQDLSLEDPYWHMVIEGIELTDGLAAVPHQSQGGGLSIGGAGTSVVTDDTFDHDVTDDAGGGVYVNGSTSITNSTFYDNTANVDSTTSTDIPWGGGDIYNSSGGSISLVNDSFVTASGGSVYNAFGYSTVVDNSYFSTHNGGGFDCGSQDGDGYSGYDNVVTGGDNTCPGIISGGTAPALVHFGVYGQGVPPTVAQLPGSAAIGAAGKTTNNTATTAAEADDACPASSENGVGRPVSACDAGAFEHTTATTVTLSATPTLITYGTPAVITATVALPADPLVPQGTVQFAVDGKAAGTPVTLYPGGTTVAYAVATYDAATLTVGTHTVTATYTSTNTSEYASATTTSALKITVNGTASSVSIASSTNPIDQGQPLTITVAVQGNSPSPPTGTVTVKDTVAGTTTAVASGVALVAGKATVVTSSLPPGPQRLTATYSGDPNNGRGTSPALTQDVRAASSVTLVPSATTTVFGAAVTLTATVATTVGSEVPTGTVVFLEGPTNQQTELGDVTLVAGVARLSATALPPGTDSVVADYSGDLYYARLATVTAGVTVADAATTTGLAVAVGGAPASGAAYGVPVALTATVANSTSTAVPAGTVTFTVGGRTVKTVALAAEAGTPATATATYTTQAGDLPLGTDEVKATLVPGAGFAVSGSATQPFKVTTTTTTVTVASTHPDAVFGQAITLTATVIASGQSKAVPAGSVEFYDGTTLLATVAAPSGTASTETSSLSVGTHQIKAVYVPGATDGAFVTSTSAVISQAVAKAATTVGVNVTPTGGTPFGTSVTVTVDVTASAPGAGTPTGQVVVTWDRSAPTAPTTLGSFTLVAGKGKVALSTLNATTYDLVVTYTPATGDFATSHVTAAYTVGADVTATALVVSPGSSKYGQTVTMTATVANKTTAAVPTGTVTFYDNVTHPLATVAVTTTGAHPGTATYTTNVLAYSTHELLATFNVAAGSPPDFDSSTSPVTTHPYSVGSATTSTTVANPGAVTVGAAVTLTATVSVTAGGGTPTGTVTFLETKTVTNTALTTLGHATVVPGGANQGTATLSVKLQSGNETIIARYSDGLSDLDYASSVGYQGVVVESGTPSVTLTSSTGSPTVYGQSVSLTATVTGEAFPYNPQGTVTFTATVPGSPAVTLGKTERITTVAGTVTITTTAVPAGTATVTATYNGSPTNYNSATSAGLSKKVTPAQTSVSLSVSHPLTVGQSAALTATVANQSTGAVPTGTVTFTYGGVQYGPVAIGPTARNGAVASVTVPTPAAGTVLVVATFVSNGDFDGSTGKATAQVAKMLTDMEPLRLSVPAVGIGQTVAVTAEVYHNFGYNPSPTGTVVITSGPSQCVARLSPVAYGAVGAGYSAVGTCTLKMSVAGTVIITAAYGGDSISTPATGQQAVVVQQLVPRVIFTASPPSGWVAGEPITLSWAIGGPSAGEGSIRISDGFSTVCTSVSLTGSCTITYPQTTLTTTEGFYLSYTGDTTYQAAYATVTGKLAACMLMDAPTVSPSGAGTVQVLTAPNCDNGTGYTAGSDIYLTATPTGSYQFQEWANSGSLSAFTLIVAQGAGPIVPWAIFNEPCVTVTIGIRHTGGWPTTGSNVDSQTRPTCPGATPSWTYRESTPTQLIMTGSFTIGSTVTAYARPGTLSSGYPAIIYGWTGLPSGGTNQTVKIPVTGPTTVFVDFGPVCYHGLTVNATDGGTASITGPSANCAEGGPGYAQGTDVGVSTKATSGQYFVRWTGYVLGGKVTETSATGTVPVVTNNEHVTAIYQSCVSLSVGSSLTIDSGQPAGITTVSPVGNCPTNSAAGWYKPGTQVTITVKANEELAILSFVGWTGGPVGFATTLRTYATVNSDETLTAEFYNKFDCRTLAVNAIPAGSETIATTYPFGNGGCPAGTYFDRWQGTRGSPVDFTATPTHGKPLQGWSLFTHKAEETGGTKTISYPGLGGSSAGTTFLGTSSATAWSCEEVTPRVDLISPDGTSNVGTAPTTGTFIDASPQTDCPIGANSYTVGTEVAPAANATPKGYQFTGWSGAETGSTPDPPAFTLTGAVGSVTVTATYKILCYALTSDYTTGEIVAPAPNCPGAAASAHEYIGGTTVVMQQTGHGDDNFDGWTGSPTGTQGTYAWVTMDQNTAVYSDYTGKSAGQKIDDALKSVGTDIAVAGKKAVGVAAAVVSGLLVGGDPITAAASLVVLIGTGISDLLSDMGVNTSGLATMNSVLSDISQTINMMTASLSCATTWAANANTSKSTSGALLQDSGSVYAKTLIADKTGASVDEDVYAEEQAADWEASQPYSLSEAPLSDAIPPSTAQRLANAAGDVADSASDTGTSVLRFAGKYGTRLGVAASAVSSIVGMASGGAGVGWDSTASAAWTGGGAVYNACLTAAEPTYMKAATAAYPTG